MMQVDRFLSSFLLSCTTVLGFATTLATVHFRPEIRVARFFLTQHTKTGKIATALPNDLKIYQMALKYSKWP
jgi:hypothetical protein